MDGYDPQRENEADARDIGEAYELTDADWCPACKRGPVVMWDHCEKCGRDVCAACYAHGDCDR